MSDTPELAYISRVTLKNIRAFKELDVSLAQGGDGVRRMSAIIGRNGTCKSTLLRAIALGLCHEADASALLADLGGQLIREKAVDAEIALELSGAGDKSPSVVRLRLANKGGRDIVIDRESTLGDVQFFACGYGAGRNNVGRTKDRDFRVLDSAATLFDYESNLADPELLFRRLRDYLGTARHERAVRGVKKILGLSARQEITLQRGGGVRVSGPGIGESIPLEAWADGYRAMFSWLMDLYGWALEADIITKAGSFAGILLVDEIDQHLHPSHQAALLASINKVLPELQVFVTTHNPLTALGTSAESIIALHRKGSKVEMMPVPDMTGYSTDDTLTEEVLFGTDPYSRETRLKLERHRKLAATDDRTSRQSEIMRRLATELDAAQLPALRDDPVRQKLQELAELLRQEVTE